MAKQRRASKAQVRLISAALPGLLTQTFVGSALGSAARAVRNRGPVQPTPPLVPKKSGRKK
jgi:hypothetical protein